MFILLCVCLIKIFSVLQFFTAGMCLWRKDHQLSTYDLVACIKKNISETLTRMVQTFWYCKEKRCFGRMSCHYGSYMTCCLLGCYRFQNVLSIYHVTFQRLFGALSLYISLVAPISCLLWPFSTFLLCYGSICCWKSLYYGKWPSDTKQPLGNF